MYFSITNNYNCNDKVFLMSDSILSVVSEKRKKAMRLNEDEIRFLTQFYEKDLKFIDSKHFHNRQIIFPDPLPEVKTNLIYGSWDTNAAEIVGQGTFDSDFDVITTRVSTVSEPNLFMNLLIQFQE